MKISDPIEVRHDLNPRLRLKPMYHLMGKNPDSRIFMQRKAHDLLLLALDALPAEYGFLIWDAYRSRACQAAMFEWMRGEVRKRYPHLNDDENFEVAKRYMSPATEPGDPYCPPHLSGGAIDLTLFSMETGEELDMGTPFDDCTERAEAMYFESSIDEAERLLRDRRRILRTAMQSAGFTPYEHEWWHFDYGNVFWSRATGKPGIFGPLFGDAEGPMD